MLHTTTSFRSSSPVHSVCLVIVSDWLHNCRACAFVLATRTKLSTTGGACGSLYIIFLISHPGNSTWMQRLYWIAQVLLAILQWFEGVGISVGGRATNEGKIYMGYDAMCILLRLATNIQKKLKRSGIDIPVLTEFLSTAVTKFGKLFASSSFQECRIQVLN